MPTYEYECTKGHTFEVVQRITEDPLTRCQICKAKAKRLIGAANFILKGGGWYSDGYSAKAGSKSASSEPASGGSSSDSSSGSGSASPGTGSASGGSGSASGGSGSTD